MEKAKNKHVVKHGKTWQNTVSNRWRESVGCKTASGMTAGMTNRHFRAKFSSLQPLHRKRPFPLFGAFRRKISANLAHFGITGETAEYTHSPFYQIEMICQDFAENNWERMAILAFCPASVQPRQKFPVKRWNFW